MATIVLFAYITMTVNAFGLIFILIQRMKSDDPYLMCNTHSESYECENFRN